MSDIEISEVEENRIEIPKSLYEPLSKKLVAVVLDAKVHDSIPSDMAKRIIYLWRQDALATETGITTLMEAATLVNPEGTYTILSEIGAGRLAVSH